MVLFDVALMGLLDVAWVVLLDDGKNFRPGQDESVTVSSVKGNLMGNDPALSSSYQNNLKSSKLVAGMP